MSWNSYYGLQSKTPDELIFNIVKWGNLPLKTPEPRQTNFQNDQKENLLLETPDSRQTNFQIHQMGSGCWCHQ